MSGVDQDIADFTASASELVQTFKDKEAGINAALEQATTELEQLIDDNFTQVFYVDALGGDNTNSGSSHAEALKTVSKAVSLITSGANVMIKLAANDTEHSMATINLPDCSLRIVDYTDVSFATERLVMRSTGSIAFNPVAQNARLLIHFSGEYEKVYNLESSRLFENPGSAQYHLSCSSTTYPLIIAFSGTLLYPFFTASNYNKVAKTGMAAMSNVVFCKTFSGTPGSYVYTNIETVSLTAMTYATAVIATFNNALFYCDTLTNNGVSLGPGTYLYTDSEDIVAAI